MSTHTHTFQLPYQKDIH